MLLVAGNAALLDQIVSVDVVPGSSVVGHISAASWSDGTWLPGGAAPTVALAAAAAGTSVALLHPIPTREAGTTLEGLVEAGIDVSRCPRTRSEPSRCLLVSAGDRRFAWSEPPEDIRFEVDAVLEGIDHVVFCPTWGAWADELVAAADDRGIPRSLVGELRADTPIEGWTVVVLDEAQLPSTAAIKAETLVRTRGARGSTVHVRGRSHDIAAVPVEPVDTTGAGDVYSGTFIGRLVLGDSPEEAAAKATRQAALACLEIGGRTMFINDATPPAATREDRVEGALWGLACGDALGMPNSFLKSPRRIEGMEPGPADSPFHAGYRPGQITDDTEQAIALIAALEEDEGRLTPETVASKLLEWYRSVGGFDSLAVGPSTKRAMEAVIANTPILEAGKGVTNGASMRIAPIGVFGAIRDMSDAELTEITLTACVPTHNTSVAVSGACAVSFAVREAIRGSDWDTVMQAGERGARLGAEAAPWVYGPSIADRIREARRLVAGATESEAANIVAKIVGTGEPSQESVPAAFAIADWARGDAEIALKLAANTQGDSDTVAAMAGAIAGAYSGVNAIPIEWRERVEAANEPDIGMLASRLEAAAKPR